MTGSPEPGWYEDPANADRRRYWDGASWTAHIEDPAPRSYSPPAGSPAAPPPSPSGREPVPSRTDPDEDQDGSERIRGDKRALLAGVVVVAAVVILLTAFGFTTRDDGADTVASSDSPPDLVSTTEASPPDRATLQASYDEEVKAACEKAKPEVTAAKRRPLLAYEWDEDYGAVLGIDQPEMAAEIRACLLPTVKSVVEAQRVADEAAEAVAAAAAEAERVAEVERVAEANRAAEAERQRYEGEQAARQEVGISAEEFAQIQTGMSVRQVESIIGSPGEVLAETTIAGYNGLILTWSGEPGTGLGANANMQFQDGVLISKAQFGL